MSTPQTYEIDLSDGNPFSILSVLQHAICHLMRSTGEGYSLKVGLDGDFAAILKLQSAEQDVLNAEMCRMFNEGYDKCMESRIA